MRLLRHLHLTASLLLLALWPAMLHAQAPDISLDRSDLDGTATFHFPWRYSASEVPGIASPAFDDSAWSSLPPKALLPARTPDPNHLWIRMHLRMAVHGRPLAILLTTKGSIPYQVYANGKLIGESPGVAGGNLQRPKPFAMALPSDPDILLAIRFVAPRFYRIAFMPLVSLDLGSPSALATDAQLRRIQEFDEQFTAQILGVVLSLALGLFAGVLYLAQAGRPEYLWLAIFGLLQASYIACRVALGSGMWPFSATALFIYRYVAGFAMICFLEFLLYLARVKGRRLARPFQAASLLIPLLGFFSERLFELALILFLLMVTAYLVSLLVRAWRLDVTESKLLVPSFGFLVCINFLSFLSQVFPGHFWYPRELHVGSVGVGAEDVAVWFLLASLIGVLLFRFIHVSHDEQRSAAEFEAARNVQNIFIPEQVPSIPGFVIDSIYQPAQHVGGDFFQIIPLPGDAGTLIALGDVSGKGLPAAMTVAVILGTLRTAADYTHSPADIMNVLNRRLHHRGVGFTTCIVLRLIASGEAILTSAGHLEPYLAGQALALEATLPLGLSSDIVYTETSVLLPRGQSLTLLTDGVVEAFHPHTRELFGFDRTLAISACSAREIAAAAHRFSAPAPQSDDITVLTIVHA